ncbi:MAG TPA: tannase/feruloyl esterase family alpha/beta hydrolase [Gammaproteobacteria bacterium]
MALKRRNVARVSGAYAAAWLVVQAAFFMAPLMAQSLRPPAPAAPMLTLRDVAPVIECEALLKVDAVFTDADLTHLTSAAVFVEAGKRPYCRVEGYIAPQIRFALHLPTEGWNQRYLQNGCGGYCGTLASPDAVDAAAGCAPVEDGAFARSATDGGHTAPFDDGLWAVDDPQAQVDLGYRAAHEVAVASKRIIAAFYGQGPRYSYFTGCSDGGREALMETQRYPEDFDGIVAGAPANIWSSLNGIFQPWVIGSNKAESGGYVITPEKIPALARAARETCDGVDGLEDGIIADPRACEFDPGVIECPAGREDGADCLTAAQVAAARRIYAAPAGLDGRALYPGSMPVGSEAPWAEGITAPAGQRAIAEGYASYRRYLDRDVALDLGMTHWTIDAAELAALRSGLGTIYDSTDPDLSAFSERGGKLILWHGWADEAIPPHGTIAYFDAVREAVGGAAERDAFVRLYMIPGMYHCSRGDFDRFDFLTPVMNWVERDAAPEGVVAWTAQGDVVTRSRPLYPYPAVARYVGSGDVDDAANFTPAVPARQFESAYEWAGEFESGYQRVCGWNGDPFRGGDFVCEPAE